MSGSSLSDPSGRKSGLTMKLSPKVRSGVQDPSLVWRAIPGFEDFEVSEYGDLRKGDRYMIPQLKSGSGRKHYRIYSKGKAFSFYAHQLVALAFIGPSHLLMLSATVPSLSTIEAPT